MAVRTIAVVTDDLDGSDAQQTVSFGLDGVIYEIDLSETNADELRNALAPYIKKGRRSGGRRKAPVLHDNSTESSNGQSAAGTSSATPPLSGQRKIGPRAGAKRPGKPAGKTSRKPTGKNANKSAKSASTTRKKKLQDVREWAAQNGHDVRASGRLPRAIVDAYTEATGNTV